MGKLSRNKGKRFERAIATKLRELGLETRRGWQTRSGSDDPDVICDALGDCWIECKVGARPNVVAAMEQAREAAPAGRAPVAITHWDRGATLVTMDLEDWLEWVRERTERAALLPVFELKGREAGGGEASGDGEGLRLHEGGER